MDTKTLEIYRTLYERRSLRQAAELLYISLQGLGRILQSLENELDTILFTRTARGLEPTDAGKYLYQQVGPLLQAHRQLEQNVQRVGGRGKELSFVCSYGVMNALPYPLFQEFQRENPSYTFKWQEFPDHQAERLLLKDQYELGLFVLGSRSFGEDYLDSSM